MIAYSPCALYISKTPVLSQNMLRSHVSEKNIIQRYELFWENYLTEKNYI